MIINSINDKSSFDIDPHTSRRKVTYNGVGSDSYLDSEMIAEESTTLKNKIYSFFGVRDGTKECKWKKLSYMESKCLSEFGAYLSEEKSDHEGAIITLMKALRHQTCPDGTLNIDCANTLTHLGDVFMRLSAASSNKDDMMESAKQAEFCFVQAVDIYRTFNCKENEVKLMNRLNKSKRLQLWMRRKISFSDDPPKALDLSSSSTSSLYSAADYEPCNPAVSDITWMDSYSSEYYRQQHSIYLKESVGNKKPRNGCIFEMFEGNMCSWLHSDPPISTIEFVEERLCPDK